MRARAKTPAGAVFCVVAAGLIILSAAAVLAAEPIATLRGAEISDVPPAPEMAPQATPKFRAARNYPEQPPVIPHKIRDYRIDLNSNKCMSCHSRAATEQSQAPMVSVTHFMDRDGQVLGSVTPRRYFCTQCHVPQLDVRPLVGSTFVDVDTAIQEGE